MKEQCVDKNVGPAARCRSEEIRGVCVKVLKQRMAFCNFPLAAAERCERVNVDVYAPRNMRNVIDSMAEINTYCVRFARRCWISKVASSTSAVSSVPCPSV